MQTLKVFEIFRVFNCYHPAMLARRAFAAFPLRSWLWALLFTSIATAGLIFLQRELPDWFNLPLVAIMYLLAINLATQTAGFGAGVLAAIAAFFGLNFFFIDPRGSLLVSNITDLLLLAFFLIVALVNNQLLVQAQRRAIEAAQRERDATRFYELSLALISGADANDIADKLATKLCDILHADAVEVVLKPLAGAQTIRVFCPPGVAPTTPPAHSEPILSTRASFGDVRLWRAAALTLGEERLLRTFAAESALILERARTSSVETRARVLEESDRLKSAMLGLVSHELRTPLATIRAGVESLRSGLVAPGSDAGRELLEDVSDAANHLTRLVNNMLDMSKIESGALKPAREWVDLADIAHSTAARLRKNLRQHTLEICVPDDMPLVPADPVQLDQVFTNLITNSVKYAPAGTAVRILAMPMDDGVALVQVRNESPQLPAEDLERIFDKFYRVTQVNKVVGTGLGLSICKGIIDAHGGRIWAANAEGGQGVVFNFTLPLTWDGAGPKLPPPEPLEGST
jgi:two-component system sensor histidine kinase KdpD